MLKKLELTGFKSFAGKTTLDFSDGITAVVGPNGSGKCLDGDSLVLLANGRQEKIRDLVEKALDKSSPQKMDDGFVTQENPDNVEVFSLNPKSQKIEKSHVAAFVKRRAPKNLLQIKTRSGRGVTTTLYHPLFCVKDGELKALEADKLAPGLKIVTPRVYHLESYDDRLDLLETLEAFREADKVYIPYSLELREFLLTTAAQYGGLLTLANLMAISYEGIRTISSSQAINVAYVPPLMRLLQSVLVPKLTEIKSKGAGRMKIPKKLDKNIARFLGYIISEGRVNKNAQVWFVNSDRAILEDFKDATFKAFGLKAKEFNYKPTTSDVIIFSRVLGKFLQNVFGLEIGGSSFNKKIPSQLYRASREVVWEFISALFEGDGYFHVKTSGKKHQIYIEYATASKELAEGLATLLLREGVIARVCPKVKYASNTIAKTKRTYYSVFISGAENFSILTARLSLVGEKQKKLDMIKDLSLTGNPNLDVIPGLSPLVKDLVREAGIKIKKIRKDCPKLAAYYENRCEFSRMGIKEILGIIEKHGTLTEKANHLIGVLQIFANSDVYYDEITEIKKVEGREWVYDLCIERNHNFVANNIVVHNSNVVDALRWLLGERDAKNLRGGKVEDLIFAGTPKKPRLGMAKASIYLDNSTQVFPVEYGEVVVSREVDRGGNSRYFLNQAEVRLRDLVDFFARARLGVRGLVVIGQGESDMFLLASSEEKREMIEEILGLREYQLKKAEAERKFKNTTINLGAAEALLKEIVPHLRALKRQTSRWDRRLEIQTELKNFESIFYGARLAEIQTELVALKPQSERITAQISEEEKSLAQLQKNVDMTEGSGTKHHRELKKFQEERIAYDTQKSKLEKEVGRLEAQIEFLRERASESNDEVDVVRAIPFLKRLKSQLESLYAADFETVKREVVKILEEVRGLFLVKKRSGMTLREAESLHQKNSAELAKFTTTLDELKNKEREVVNLIESHSGEFKEALSKYQAKRDAIKDLEQSRNKIFFAEERSRLKLEDLKQQVETASVKFNDITHLTKVVPADFNQVAYERNIMRLRGELASMGEVDQALIQEAHETEERHAFLTAQANDLRKAFADLLNLKQELEVKINTEFESALKNINKELARHFGLMFGGGHASLRISAKGGSASGGKNKKTESEDGEGDSVLEENEENKEPEPEGIDIEVSIPRKRITGLSMLSGGERSLVSIAVLFALAAVSPPPFLVLDEMDAALDERNARRFAEMLSELSKKTQFVLVTHNRATMEAANILYGVTMGEDGTSKVLSLKLE